MFCTAAYFLETWRHDKIKRNDTHTIPTLHVVWCKLKDALLVLLGRHCEGYIYISSINDSIGPMVWINPKQIAHQFGTLPFG